MLESQIRKTICSVDAGMCEDMVKPRGGGTGGAGGAIAPPNFGILLNKQPLAPPTYLFGSVNSSTTNFSYLPPPLPYF